MVAASKPRIYPARVVDPGLHDGVVVVAQFAYFEWRQSHRNPTGCVVRVGVEITDSQGGATVFDALDLSAHRRIEAAFRSCGLTPPADHLAEALDDLIGRPCVVSAKIISPRAGTFAGVEKSVISEWFPPGSSGAV